MSAPEQTNPETTVVTEPGEAIAQLRVLVCGLGAAVLVLSLAFDVFVFKQNRNLQGEARNRSQQANQIGSLQERWASALNDLAHYSTDKPELTGIFKKYGIEITSPTSETLPSAPAQP